MPMTVEGRSCIRERRGEFVELMFILSRFAPRAHEPIGPSTLQGVAKMQKDEAARMWTAHELSSLRVVLP
jgi:hypothetical protein